MLLFHVLLINLYINRLKELIKKYGAGNFSVPKRIVDTKKNNDDPVLNLKMDYVTSLVSILASQFANDYREVALFVQKEAKKATNAKGFGSK